MIDLWPAKLAEAGACDWGSDAVATLCVWLRYGTEVWLTALNTWLRHASVAIPSAEASAVDGVRCGLIVNCGAPVARGHLTHYDGVSDSERSMAS